jgi:hypothetical protein
MMGTDECGIQPRLTRQGAAAIILALGFSFSVPSHAQYYVGPSYLRIAHVEAGPNNPRPYRNWVRAEANYWTLRPLRPQGRGRFNALTFTTSRAPQKGPDVLSLAIAKTSPAYPALMEKCRRGERIARIDYAESSEMTRVGWEDAPRPRDLPEFYEFALKDVSLNCPVVAAAPEQAFQLAFKEIEWLNSRFEPAPRVLSDTPAKLTPVTQAGMRRVYVVHWVGAVADSRNDQCPAMNVKPTDADYYALMSPARAAEQQAKLAAQGGVTTNELGYRGPGEMDVTKLPGIVADPGFHKPEVDVVRGFDLDGDDGTGEPPAHTRKHRNYISPDGRRGIDNQLFSVIGCISNWRRTGFQPNLSNEMRRAGGLSMLFVISGIDDERNDSDVDVTVTYSTDPMRRDGGSKIILPDFTFRLNPAPEYSKAYARFKGRMVDGVIVTDPIDTFLLRESKLSNVTAFYNARLRVEQKPDGTMAAVLGGYLDWRSYVHEAFAMGAAYETTIGFPIPGMYNEVRRAADGLKDPVTGEYNGISAAWEFEGVRAFIPQVQERALLEGKIADLAKAGSGSSSVAQAR